MNTNNNYNFKKYLALITIYLIISLTFFTAHAMAVLNHSISGENDVSGFARRDGDLIKIDVNANSNVSFIIGQNTQAYSEIPLDGCVLNNATGLVNCVYPFEPTDINTNIENIPFVLKQESGSPITQTGILYIDGIAPQQDYLKVTKDGDGLYFDYSFTDYLADVSEGTACKGSGIGYVEIDVQNKPIFEPLQISTQNCTVSGTFFKNFSNSYNDKVRYSVIVRDRTGNEYRPGPKEISGDFRPPLIANSFKIIRNGEELSILSSNGQINGDVVVQITDSSLNQNSVYGDLSNLNINPAINIPYKNIQAGCIKESGDTFICTFQNISLRPASSELSIIITAKDADGNPATKVIKKSITLGDSAGKVLHLGPSKSHCTSDLEQCYTKSGRQFLYAELDAVSSYNTSFCLVKLGISDDSACTLCRLNNTWTCTGMYNIPNTAGSINMYIAESYDDYGNMLESSFERSIIIDDTGPQNVSALTVVSNNNNMDCAVAGDELTFKVKVKEDTPELKIYVNTSGFTSYQQQKGTCTLTNGIYDCELKVKGFSSVASKNPRTIILEDLAGNKNPLPYTFEVCKAVASSIPNVIYDVDTKNSVSINRRTASKITVSAYIPVKFDIQEGSKLMYLNVERCTAFGTNGLNVMGSKHYFMPNYGNQTTLVLSIGHEGAMLPEGSLDINCTISARVRVARTVFTQDERETFTIKVATFDQSLGTIDDATITEINNVKKRTRELDKSIDNLKKIDQLLGNACRLAEKIGQVNYMAQTVKSVIYVILLIAYSIAATAATTGVGGIVATPAMTAIQGWWAAVQKPIGGLNVWMNKYIWPPGLLPGGLVGSIVKYSCMVYTCKLYDVGSYTGLVMELAATGNLGELPIDKKVGIGTGGVGTTGKDGAQYVGTSTTISQDGYTEKDVAKFRNKFESEKYSLAGKDYVKFGKDSSGTWITKTSISQSKDGYKLTEVTYQNSLTDAQKADVRTKTIGSLDALNGNQWIINPYRSVHYDGICIPAMLYNNRKERQINCMYIACMEAQANSGIPKAMCDGDYKINKCIYLDSAEYLLSGSSVWRSLVKGFGESLKNSALGLSINAGYMIGCWNYYLPAGDLADVPFKSRGWHSALCGAVGASFGIKEITDTIKNPFAGLKPADVSDEQDYCRNVDYTENSEVDVSDPIGGEIVD